MTETPETDRVAYDIVVWDNEELRREQHSNGDHVEVWFARDLEKERNSHFEVLRQVADLFEITDWDSTTLVQQLRVWKNEMEGMG